MHQSLRPSAQYHEGWLSANPQVPFGNSVGANLSAETCRSETAFGLTGHAQHLSSPSAGSRPRHLSAAIRARKQALRTVASGATGKLQLSRTTSTRPRRV